MTSAIRIREPRMTSPPRTVVCRARAMPPSERFLPPETAPALATGACSLQDFGAQWRVRTDLSDIPETKAKEGRNGMNRVRFPIAAIGLMLFSVAAFAQVPGAIRTVNA